MWRGKKEGERKTEKKGKGRKEKGGEKNSYQLKENHSKSTASAMGLRNKSEYQRKDDSFLCV